MRSDSARDAILGLDHVVLVVAALDPAVAVYAVILGRDCRDRGEGWARFALANTALVLAEAGAAPLAARAEGIGALAFAVADPDSTVRLLERRGLPAAGPALPWLGRAATPLAPEAARGLPLLLTAPDPAPRPADTMRLDHLVIRSGDPERTVALLGGRLGLDLRLDRSNPAWGARLLFFRCGDLVLEVSHALSEGITDAPDTPWGMTWGAADLDAAHARIAAAGLPVSPLRTGRKPGTRIFTIRDNAALVPTAVIGA